MNSSVSQFWGCDECLLWRAALRHRNPMLKVGNGRRYWISNLAGELSSTALVAPSRNHKYSTNKRYSAPRGAFCVSARNLGATLVLRQCAKQEAGAAPWHVVSTESIGLNSIRRGWRKADGVDGSCSNRRSAPIAGSGAFQSPAISNRRLARRGAYTGSLHAEAALIC